MSKTSWIQNVMWKKMKYFELRLKANNIFWVFFCQILRLSLKVNELKTDQCLFLKRDSDPLTVMINSQGIRSGPTIAVLGVIFDSKIQWTHKFQTQFKKPSRHLMP